MLFDQYFDTYGSQEFGKWNAEHKTHDLEVTLPFGGERPHDSVCSRDCLPGSRIIQEVYFLNSYYSEVSAPHMVHS